MIFFWLRPRLLAKTLTCSKCIAILTIGSLVFMFEKDKDIRIPFSEHKCGSTQYSSRPATVLNCVERNRIPLVRVNTLPSPD